MYGYMHAQPPTRGDETRCGQDSQRRLCDHPHPRTAIDQCHGHYRDDDWNHHQEEALRGPPGEEGCSDDDKRGEHRVETFPG